MSSGRLTYLADTGKWRARRYESIRGIAQLGDLIFDETVRPLLRSMGEVVGRPSCRACDLLRELIVGLDFVEVWRSLPARLDAVWEDLRIWIVVGEASWLKGRSRQCLGERWSHCGFDFACCEIELYRGVARLGQQPSKVKQ